VRCLFFLDVTQRILEVTDVSEPPVVPTFKDKGVQEEVGCIQFVLFVH